MVIGDIRVSADFTAHAVRIDVAGLGHFTMSRQTAFAFARKVEGAADALGPEPPAVAPAETEWLDLTDQVEVKTK